jgi:hypothetical protein
MEFIYFYLINPETLKPELENVMQNYTSCNMMMIGPARRFAITYATGENSFNLFKRKYMHNFRV